MAENNHQAQQLLGQAQVFQQQMQAISMQKENLNMQSIEIINALDELEKAKTGDVFKIAGPILINTSKEETSKDLKERKELIGIKIKTLEKSEKKIKNKLDELKEKLAKTGLGS